jgi:large subunit ribosomal protein L6|tara:strand:+ start:791 stop:1324 length:534 start_codon:yes stop_codon:yes gene_type:complete
MSRIAKNGIKLPQDTTCSFDNNILLVQGKLGEATLSISELFTIKQKDNEILILPKDEKDKTNPLWGTTSAHVKNTLSGVCNGYSKTLVLSGTGYKASVVDSKLKLQLGFSHDIDYEIPKEVKIECPKQNIIKITSIHKDILGAVAAKIRSYKKPEPFKGKGIKYENEFIFRKEGKKK